MKLRRPSPKRISRRGLLIGGGAGVGLVVAWTLWPRDYAPNLVAAEGETILGPYLKIANTGRVTVVVPQVEMGQGVYTTLPQIVADELGADWRTVGVEPAPINPLYANRLIAREDRGALPAWMAEERAVRAAAMVTARSTSVRAFEAPLREAGAAARVLLCMAAAARWDAEWEACDTEGGFVVSGERRLRFGELAEEAAGFTQPEQLPLRVGGENRLTGRSLPRLDLPSKVDGSGQFAADVRLPGMVFASVRQGPIGDTSPIGIDKAAADAVPGVLAVVENPRWVATVATNWWAANRALDAMRPNFATEGAVLDNARIDAALGGALEANGTRVAERGDLAASFRDAQVHAATYSVGAAVHAPVEPMTATADWSRERLRLWVPTQSQTAARAAVAEALGIGVDRVTLFPMLLGGSFGRKLGHEAAVQAAIIARQLNRPVQLTWSRIEDIIHDRFRTPARARMTARLRADGALDGWRAQIAAPEGVMWVEGSTPPYAIPNLSVEHHAADTGVPIGEWRSNAHSYTAFFNECFLDELANLARVDPFSWRMQLLAGEPRLARCLQMAGTLGGWQGPKSGQGIAVHSSRGSHVAVIADARIGTDQRIAVDRIVAVADCGRMINPDIVRQQIEGGVVFGLTAALGGSTGFERGLPTARRLSDLNLPTLATMPELSVELIESDADPGGVSEVAVPPVAPAIANALFAASGRRLRSLPLSLG